MGKIINKVLFKCNFCKKEFFGLLSQRLPSRNKNNFCSRNCYFNFLRKEKTNMNLWKGHRLTKNCLICNKVFTTPISSNDKHCSQKCYWKNLEGKTTWNKGKSWSKEVRLKLKNSWKKEKHGLNSGNFKKGHQCNDNKNWCEAMKNMTPWAKGKTKFNDKRLLEVSKRMKKWLATDEGKEHIYKNLTKQGMSWLEKKTLYFITKNNLPYKFVGDGKFFIERKIPDFVNINGEKKVVEVFSKSHKENLKKISIEKWKQDRSKLFSSYGYETIFIEYADINEKNIIRLLS